MRDLPSGEGTIAATIGESRAQIGRPVYLWYLRATGYGSLASSAERHRLGAWRRMGAVECECARRGGGGEGT
eukprot:scaffold121663_cov55-Phaeocystis_antarctica.AAC.1